MTTATDWQAAYDNEDYRRSLYTNTKDDHPVIDLTGEPCDCQAGGRAWERNGIAMRVAWPPRVPLIEAPGELAGPAPTSRHGDMEMEAGG